MFTHQFVNFGELGPIRLWLDAQSGWHTFLMLQPRLDSLQEWGWWGLLFCARHLKREEVAA